MSIYLKFLTLILDKKFQKLRSKEVHFIRAEREDVTVVVVLLKKKIKVIIVI